MKTYTRDQLCAVFNINALQFDQVVEEMSPRSGLPPVFKIKTPIDTGERAKAKYLIHILDRGWAFFPSLASTKLWNQTRAMWVAM